MRKKEIEAIREKERKIDFLVKLGYTKEESEKMRLRVSSPSSYLHWMYKDGISKEESIKKISDLAKIKSKRCKEYWMNKGYNLEESKKLVSSYQDNVSLESTLKNGGDIKDYEVKCKNRKINKDRYISIYGEDEGIKRWISKKNSCRQTIANMILKYGEEDGTKRWNKYIENQKVSQSKDGLVKKHGQERALIICNQRRELHQYTTKKYIETGDHKFLTNSYSKSSQKLFWSLYKKLPNKLKDKCYFQELNHEFVLIRDNKECYLYDFVISNIKLCIEFNGDIWHANPNKYESSDLIFNKKAIDIWNNDTIKINFLKERRGIDTVVIWESDWIKNRIEVEKNIIQIIKDQTEKLSPQEQFLEEFGLANTNPLPLSPPE